MLNENIIYIDYIEKSITQWYSIENNKINISKEFPIITYELLMIYSFIFKYSHYFNMNKYTIRFLGRYFEIIRFIYNFFLCKASIRGFNIDAKNQLHLWFSLILHHTSYYFASYSFPLNIPIYFNYHINKLYQHLDENNLIDNEQSIIIKSLYNLGLFYYLNGQNDKAITNLKEAKDIIINTDNSTKYKNSIFNPFIYKKMSMPLYKKNLNNIITSKDSLQLINDIETNRFSTATTFSDNINFSLKNDFQNIKITMDKIKETYLKNKISIEDINLLINYGIRIGLLNENGEPSYMIQTPSVNKSPKTKFKYLTIPGYFFNPLLRKIELFISEIELSRKNYTSAYDHILKALYILISLGLNKKGSENIKFNTERNLIQKYIELIISHNNENEKENVDINLGNQSTLNNINNNNATIEKNNKDESNEKIINKYNTNINTKVKKKKKLIVLCEKNDQDYKILKEIQKFFIFLNTLSLYQLNVLNQTQPDSNKKNDLPIFFSDQFKDSLTNRQRFELNNVQTMALTRFMVLKDENNWIMPNNLNIGIIDQNRIKSEIRRKTIKFVNKYLITDDKEIPIRKTREYLKFQEIVNSKNINKELKEYINDNFSIVMRLIKKTDDDEIKNIIDSPNVIIEPIKLYKNKKRKKLKKYINKDKDKENNDDIYRFNNKNNYDYDSNYSSNKKESRNNSKSLSTNISLMKTNTNHLNLNQKGNEISEDEFEQ